MTDLDLSSEPPPAAARRPGLAGPGPGGLRPPALGARVRACHGPYVERRLRAGDGAPSAHELELVVPPPVHGVRVAAGLAAGVIGRAGTLARGAGGNAPRGVRGGTGGVDASPAATAPARAPNLDHALVVPAGTQLRGTLRCRALVLAGDIVGSVHCAAGPVVIRAGATFEGRLVAAGDVCVCGCVRGVGGGPVISTRGRLTLAPGARVLGDVRSRWLDLYDGATLDGAAQAADE